MQLWGMLRLLFLFALVWKLARWVGGLVVTPLCWLARLALRREYHGPTPGSQSYVGFVTRVVDGDTVDCRINGTVHRIRLLDLDAPEHDQEFGAEATASLRELVDSKWVEVQATGLDCYGRVLAHLFVDRRWVNSQMVAAGAAWSIAEGAVAPTFRKLQLAAMRAKVGLWSRPSPIHPRDWRNAQKATGNGELVGA